MPTKAILIELVVPKGFQGGESVPSGRGEKRGRRDETRVMIGKSEGYSFRI